MTTRNRSEAAPPSLSNSHVILRRLCVTAACVHALSSPASAMSRRTAPVPAEQAGAETDPQDSVTRKGAKPKHEFGGFMQMYYRVRLDANGDGVVEPSLFRVQRVRLQAKGRLNTRVAYEVDIDPADSIGSRHLRGMG